MLAEDPEVGGLSLIDEPTSQTLKALLEKDSMDTIRRIWGSGPEETIVTQRLFEHFRRRKYDSAAPERHHTVQLEADVQREWRAIIRKKLYAEQDKDDPGMGTGCG